MRLECAIYDKSAVFLKFLSSKYFVSCTCIDKKEVLKKRLEKFSVSNPDVKDIRILVAGQIEGAKSSFNNSVNNVFQGRITSSAIAYSSRSFNFTTKVSIIF